MRTGFREFLQLDPINLHLREEDAAAPAPPSPTTDKYHFQALKMRLGIDQASFDAALQGGTIQLWITPDYSYQWGFLVNGPVQGNVQKRSDDNYDVTILLSQKKQMDPYAFIYPYHKGDKPIFYDGPVQDQKVTMSEEELIKLMTSPLKNMPSQAGGGMPPGGPQL